MKCLVLAAGYATRLYPLTENFPKPLLKIKDKTILDWLIDDIDSLKIINEYVIISNHKYYNFFIEWAKNKSQNIKIINDGSTSNENRLGAVKDIEFALKSLNIDEDILVVAGDNVLNFSLAELLKYSKIKKCSCVMRYFEPDINKLIKSGVVTVDENDKVMEMTEKSFSPKSNWCCPPFYYYTKDDAKLIERAINEGCNTDAPGSYLAWLCKNSTVFAMEMPGKRYDIGDLSSYEKVQKEFKGIC